MSSSIPLLNQKDLSRTSLEFKARYWSVPKSDLNIGYLAIEGKIGESGEPAEDLRNLDWRIDELRSISEIRVDRIILDFRKVNTGSHHEALCSRLSNRSEIIRVLVHFDDLESYRQRLDSDKLSANYKELFSELQFELRDARFDKGRDLPTPGGQITPRLFEQSLGISDIKFEFNTWAAGKFGYTRIMGKYRHGSAGSDDALFIRWRLNQFAEAVPILGIVIDVRELKYEWGDEIDLYPLRFSGDDACIRFVLRSEQVAAYSYEIQENHISLDAEEAFSTVQSLAD